MKSLLIFLSLPEGAFIFSFICMCLFGVLQLLGFISCSGWWVVAIPVFFVVLGKILWECT